MTMQEIKNAMADLEHELTDLAEMGKVPNLTTVVKWARVRTGLTELLELYAELREMARRH